MNQDKPYYQIVYAPNDIFKKQAEYIDVVDDSILLLSIKCFRFCI